MKNLECQYCEHKSLRRDHLIRHMKRKHDIDVPRKTKNTSTLINTWSSDNASDHENEEFEEIKESDSDLEILENDQDVKTLESDELKKVSNNNNSEVADQTLVID